MKKRVLIISKWYPTRNYSSAGIFVRRHALAALPYSDVAVLHAESDSSVKGWKIEESVSTYEGLPEYIYFYAKEITGIPSLDKALKFIQYFRCISRGFRRMTRELGVFDLVHATVLLRTGLFAYFLKLTKGIPYIITEHWTGYLSPAPGKSDHRPSGFRKWCLKRVIRAASCICPASDDLGQAMRSLGLNNRYQTIHNVVDTSFFSPLPGNRNAGKISLVTVAMMLDEHKNISGILRVLARLKNEGIDFEHRFIGRGSDQKKFISLSQYLGLENQVVFDGQQPAEIVAEAMRNADAFVLFSHYENLPCVIIEAFASGIPVIATDVGGIREMITNSKLGELISSNDEEQLYNAIKKVISRKGAYDKSYISAYAESQFGMDVIGKKLGGVYEL